MRTLGVVVVPPGEPGPGPVLGGNTLLDRALAALRGCPDVDDVVVLEPGQPPPDRARTDADEVVLHDISFPLVDAATVGAVLGALRADPAAAAAVAVLPVTDTLKQVDPAGTVLGTVDRTALRVAGSPQAYRVDLLTARGPAGVGHPFVDAAALPRDLVAAGRRVVLVDAPPGAFRVRSALDLLAARALLGEAV